MVLAAYSVYRAYDPKGESRRILFNGSDNLDATLEDLIIEARNYIKTSNTYSIVIMEVKEFTPYDNNDLGTDLWRIDLWGTKPGDTREDMEYDEEYLN